VNASVNRMSPWPSGVAMPRPPPAYGILALYVMFGQHESQPDASHLGSAQSVGHRGDRNWGGIRAILGLHVGRD